MLVNDPKILGNFQNLIRSALRHIEQNTCIRFKEGGRDRDGLRFFRGSGCWSNVGRTGGRQLVSIGYGCDSLGIVAHETLHALGLWHEQSRDDRDKFIKIVTDRIIRGTEGNFEKRTPQTSDNMGQPYDLGSVMHYGPKAFTQDWNVDTIETRDKRYQHTIGQREGISFKDAKMINLRYCMNVCPTKLPCKNDGYTDPNNCAKCLCPKGYNGVYCTEIERTSCGEELTTTQNFQTIRSGPVYANSYCVWRIKSPAGQKVQVIIDSLSFPCLDTCTSFLEVKEAQSKTATGARLCCKSGDNFYSEGDDIILIFKGDSQIQSGYQGFSARYRYYGNAMNTPPTTNRPTATTTSNYIKPTATTVEARGEWGLWGEWAVCSATCGGGERSRLRACYGGNRRCSGSSVQTESCNTNECVDGTGGGEGGGGGTCTGRILLPCDLLEIVMFGESTNVYRDSVSSNQASPSSDHRSYSDCGASHESTYHILRKREQFGKFSNDGICEKKFTYQCPTSLLTIHMDWKKESAPPLFYKSRSSTESYFYRRRRCGNRHR
ncbi:hypothetical protein RB195_012659 [Necator americanus]|uniref:Zinc metalloproteinase n=1 Tax=Necator americanus TaxID=51031 RepID=A0ABR1DRZ5_NECAM